MLHFMILQTLWKCCFLMFSEHFETGGNMYKYLCANVLRTLSKTRELRINILLYYWKNICSEIGQNLAENILRTFNVSWKSTFVFYESKRTTHNTHIICTNTVHNTTHTGLYTVHEHGTLKNSVVLLWSWTSSRSIRCSVIAWMHLKYTSSSSQAVNAEGVLCIRLLIVDL